MKTKEQTKLSKDLGDNGDQLSQKPIYIYHIPDVKIGSTYNVKRRVMEQGYDLEDVEILYKILPHSMSFNAIWRTEQIEARKRGYPDEHDGNRRAVNRVRASGGINNRRSYILTNMETGEEILVQDASDFEAVHELTPHSISRTANPNQERQRYVTIDGIRYMADYAE
mgnify:CR=1 FL=1|tara:strand:- start:1990 stop:2493 length:504 start_codon:yes stop_codon:yes gene_type:complete